MKVSTYAPQLLCLAAAVSAAPMPDSISLSSLIFRPFIGSKVTIPQNQPGQSQIQASSSSASALSSSSSSSSSQIQSSTSTTASTTASTTTAAGTAAGTPAAAPAPAEAAQPQPSSCSNPETHIEWRNLSPEQRTAYLGAEKCLMDLPSKGGYGASQSAFGDLSYVHQQLTPNIHGVGQFLPWHRYFLYAHETLLRNECNYTGPMTWWDETKDTGNFKSAPLFTSEYFGTLQVSEANVEPPCVTDGVFSNTTLYIGPGDAETTHCLSRAVNETVSGMITTSFINDCQSNTNYTSFWDCLYSGPHALGHDAVGGVMADLDTSPGDPVFFMHHGFVDHAWRIWENVNPSGNDYQLSGWTTQNEPSTGWVEVTLDFPLTMKGLVPDITVQDVMDTEAGILCYKYDY